MERPKGPAEEDELDFGIQLGQVRYRQADRREDPHSRSDLVVMTYGGQDEGAMPVYIRRDVYEQIERHAGSDTSRELGGVLLGGLFEGPHGSFLEISDCIAARETENEATQIKFTHRTWEVINAELENRPEDLRIVGWYHTHPSFGIFLSSYDMFIQRNFFKEPWQVALVVDPVNHDRGVFQWRNDKVVLASGFHLYAARNETRELELLVGRMTRELPVRRRVRAAPTREVLPREVMVRLALLERNLTYGLYAVGVLVAFSVISLLVMWAGRMRVMAAQEQMATRLEELAQRQSNARRGAVLLAAEDYEGAVRELRLATKLEDPRDPEVYFNLAQAFEFLGYYDQAGDNYDKAVRLVAAKIEANEADPEAQQPYIRSYAGFLVAEVGRTPSHERDRLLENLLDEVPTDVSTKFLYQLGTGDETSGYDNLLHRIASNTKIPVSLRKQAMGQLCAYPHNKTANEALLGGLAQRLWLEQQDVIDRLRTPGDSPFPSEIKLALEGLELADAARPGTPEIEENLALCMYADAAPMERAIVLEEILLSRQGRNIAMLSQYIMDSVTPEEDGDEDLRLTVIGWLGTLPSKEVWAREILAETLHSDVGKEAEAALTSVVRRGDIELLEKIARDTEETFDRRSTVFHALGQLAASAAASLDQTTTVLKDMRREIPILRRYLNDASDSAEEWRLNAEKTEALLRQRRNQNLTPETRLAYAKLYEQEIAEVDKAHIAYLKAVGADESLEETEQLREAYEEVSQRQLGVAPVPTEELEQAVREAEETAREAAVESMRAAADLDQIREKLAAWERTQASLEKILDEYQTKRERIIELLNEQYEDEENNGPQLRMAALASLGYVNPETICPKVLRLTKTGTGADAEIGRGAKDILSAYWEQVGDRLKAQEKHEEAVQAYGFVEALEPETTFWFWGDGPRIQQKITKCRQAIEARLRDLEDAVMTLSPAPARLEGEVRTE